MIKEELNNREKKINNHGGNKKVQLKRTGLC